MDGQYLDRFHIDVPVSMRDMLDTYLPPFQACVESGNVSGLMCSYNSINGTPSCANTWLIGDLARRQWGFDGYVISDAGADGDVFSDHHFTSTPEEAVAAVLHAGVDVDLGGFVGSYATKALASHHVSMADIEMRLAKSFRVRLRLGHFDPPGPLQQLTPSRTVCTPESQSLARDGMAQAAALLKNVDARLPLDRATAGRVAVIGPTANQTMRGPMGMVSYYGPREPCGQNYYNLVDGLAPYAEAIASTPGVPDVLSVDLTGIKAAEQMAHDADTVVVAIGTDLMIAKEGRDAVDLLVHSAQVQLVERVARAAKRPVIVVQLSAVPQDISFLLSNPRVGAILHVGQPSTATHGVGEIIFGRRSPAGRTVQTIYPSVYQDQLSIFEMGMRPGPSSWPRPHCFCSLHAYEECEQRPASKCPNGTNFGRTHRFYNETPVVPFGFGLSFSTFTYTVTSAPNTSHPLSLDPVRALLKDSADRGHALPSRHAGSTPLARFGINVTNTGGVDADDVVLAFLSPPGAGERGLPRQQLFDFQRVHVQRGQSAIVWLNLSLAAMALVDDSAVLRAIPGRYTLRFGVPETAPNQGFVQYSLTTI